MCEQNKILTNESFYNNSNLSTIDFQVDAFLAKRHKFPKIDPISIKNLRTTEHPTKN